MLDQLESIAADIEPLVAGLAALITLLCLTIVLRWRRRRKRRPRDLGGLEIEHGLALRENMERMRKEAPFRRPKP